MAKNKSKKNSWAIALLSVACLALVIFLVSLFVSDFIHTSKLIQDQSVLNAVSAALDKKPYKITEDDLKSVQYLSMTAENSITIGFADAVQAIADGEDESELIHTTSISREVKSIQELLKLFPEVKYIDFSGVAEKFTDVEVFSSCSALEYLVLNGSKTEDFSPLATLGGLKGLSLNNSEIGDTAFLSELKNLQILSLDETGISDLSFVSAMSGLESLSAANNEIDNTTSLSGLSALETLNLSGNKIADVSALAECKALVTLNLDQNEISDAAPIAALTSLTTLSLQENKITDAAPFTGLEKLTNLALNDNEIADWSVLDKLEENGCSISGKPEESES